MRKTLIALAVLSNLTVLSPAFAGGLEGAAETTLSWRVSFGGGQPLDPGVGLAFGYRSSEAGRLTARLLDLDLSGSGALARVAGLALFQDSYLAAQDDGSVPNASEKQSAWYTQPWVLWTAGGLAAAVALNGGVNACVNCGDGGGNPGRSQNIASIDGNGEVCGTEGVDGVPDTCAGASGCAPGDAACVNCDGSVVTQGCEGEGWTARTVVAAAMMAVRDTEPAWLSDGTGHMGDLVRR